MGNSKSSIQVILNRPESKIYYAGDTVSGQVQLTISEHTNRVKDIYLVIVGEIGYTVTHITRMQNGQINRITDRCNLKILEKTISLCHLMANQVEASSPTLSDVIKFETGERSYPFSIRLPDNLPPTLHPRDYPFVRYELQVLIGKRWGGLDFFQSYPLHIYPVIKPLNMDTNRYTIKFDKKHKTIAIKGILQQSCLLPGEQTNVSLEVFNPSCKEIRNVEVSLIQRYTIQTCERHSEMIRISVPELSHTNDEYIVRICPLLIPTRISPTCCFKSNRDELYAHVNVNYDMKFSIHMDDSNSDFDAIVPVIIGSSSNVYLNDVDKIKAHIESIDLNLIERTV